MELLIVCVAMFGQIRYIVFSRWSRYVEMSYHKSDIRVCFSNIFQVDALLLTRGRILTSQTRKAEISIILYAQTMTCMWLISQILILINYFQLIFGLLAIIFQMQEKLK